MSHCRFCRSVIEKVFVDLGISPPSNSFLNPKRMHLSEEIYPLKVFVCENCWLVQIEEFKRAKEIFSEGYAYFSSYSSTWLQHCKEYTANMMARFKINDSWQVVEIASNDGYLLQYFKESNITVLGIEPSAGTAAAAVQKGIPTRVEYFGESSATALVSEGMHARLLIGNNVLAHVPDLNDFVKGMKRLLHPEGIITLEFPHLLQLVLQNQLDTIYHEHFSYFSFHTVKTILETHKLSVFDVEEIPTHGGSLRVYAQHADSVSQPISIRLASLFQKEKEEGLMNISFYENFSAKAEKVRHDFSSFVNEQKAKNKKIAAYGAAAKGNTLLNFCNIKDNLISFVVDKSPHKQGLLLPGSHIPVVAEKELENFRPDYIVIFPWNIKEEIMEQLSYVRQWGTRFVVAIPELKIL